MEQISRLMELFDRLCILGPHFGYFEERSKSILIVPPDENKYTEHTTTAYRLKITNRSRYLVGFIGKKSAKMPWIAQKVTK